MKSLTPLLCLLMALTACKPGNEASEDKKTIYYPGTSQLKQTVEYKNGKKNGYLTEYFKNGQLKARQFYVNDTLDDSTMIYFPNGQLKTLQVFKNKKRHGCWKDFSKNGKLYAETCFKDDLLHGTSTRYSYKTNSLLKKIPYDNGLKHGVEEHFYPNGQKKSREEYFRGQVCIGTEEWYENGKKVPNDFSISVIEKKGAQLEEKLTYFVKLEDPKEDDAVYMLFNGDACDKIGDKTPISRSNDVFVLDYNLGHGGFVMETVTIAAYRKTAMGNTIIKTKSFNAVANNF